MKKLAFEIACLRCGKAIQGQRREDEHKKSFECKKCGGHFCIIFEHPSQAELEAAFIAGKLLPDIIPRAAGPPQDNFPPQFLILRRGGKVDDKKFLELLKMLNREKKGEEEMAPKSQTEIKAHKAHVRKTFYEIWMEGRDE